MPTTLITRYECNGYEVAAGYGHKPPQFAADHGIGSMVLMANERRLWAIVCAEDMVFPFKFKHATSPGAIETPILARELTLQYVPRESQFDMTEALRFAEGLYEMTIITNELWKSPFHLHNKYRRRDSRWVRAAACVAAHAIVDPAGASGTDSVSDVDKPKLRPEINDIILRYHGVIR